jgi:hypothetical protein
MSEVDIVELEARIAMLKDIRAQTSDERKIEMLDAIIPELEANLAHAKISDGWKP